MVQVGQAGRGLLGPGHHLVDGLAVLPGQRRERGSALGHDRQPGRVGLEPRGVRRDVGCDVGEQVGDLCQPVGELAGLGVVVADAVEVAAGRRRRGEGVGLVLVAGERLAGLLGGVAELVGEAEAGLLGRQGGVLARLGLDGLDLAQPEPEQVGLTRPVTSGRHHLVQLPLGGEQTFVERRVVGQERGHRVAAEAVQRLALGAGLEQAVLVGLAVHRDQWLGDLGKHGHGDRRPADERP